MLGPGKNGVRAGPARGRDADIYRRYAVGLYRQALLTRGDPAWPQHVVCDVIVNERALAAIPVRGEERMTDSVLWRIRQAVSQAAASMARRGPLSRDPRKSRRK